MRRRLVLIRHAKSDWSHPVPDEQRPLAARGRRQAPAVGEWLTQHLPRPLDLVLVSPATRAQQTWELIATGLTPSPGQVRTEPDAYTFSSAELGAVVAGINDPTSIAAVVGHNPAMEDLVAELTGAQQRMTTASLAVIGMQRWQSASGELLAVGRPADGSLDVR